MTTKAATTEAPQTEQAADGRQQITIAPDELRQIASQAATILRRYGTKGEDLRVIETDRTVLVISPNCGSKP